MPTPVRALPGPWPRRLAGDHTWINSAKAERLQAEAILRATTAAPRRMTTAEIKTIVEELASLAAVVRNADPAEIYNGLGLTLTYQPTSGTIRAKAHVSPETHGVMVGVRRGHGAYVHARHHL